MRKWPALICAAGWAAFAPSIAAAAGSSADPALFDAAFLRIADPLVLRAEGMAAFGQSDVYALGPTGLTAAPLQPRADTALRVERQWPTRLITGRRYQLDLTPHAGLGLSGMGHLAEAGATLQVSKRLKARMGEAFSVGDGAQRYGDRGRWYLFGALKGRAVGFNLTPSARGVHGEGLTADRGGFMGLMQTGFGWRKGGLQTSIGYTFTNIRTRQLGRALGHEDRLGISISLRP